jgi:hypothetical protein
MPDPADRSQVGADVSVDQQKSHSDQLEPLVRQRSRIARWTPSSCSFPPYFGRSADGELLECHPAPITANQPAATIRRAQMQEHVDYSPTSTICLRPPLLVRRAEAAGRQSLT